MIEWISAREFIPHGYCLSWDADLVSAVVIANGLIALAYMVMTAVLVIAAFAAKPAMPRWFYWSFAAFVFCCGLSHVLDNVTLWYPLYRLQAIVLALTAAVSLFAALLPLTLWVSREMDRHLPR